MTAITKTETDALLARGLRDLWYPVCPSSFVKDEPRFTAIGILVVGLDNFFDVILPGDLVGGEELLHLVDVFVGGLGDFRSIFDFGLELVQNSFEVLVPKHEPEIFFDGGVFCGNPFCG